MKKRQFSAEEHEMHVSNLLMIINEQFVSLTRNHKKRMLFDFPLRNKNNKNLIVH